MGDLHMKVYLVRHGQIPSNALRQYPAVDEQLTAVGIEQATALREKISDMKFDAVFCSPLERAKQTARIITDDRNDIILILSRSEKSDRLIFAFFVARFRLM